MIELTRLNGKNIMINCELIQYIEETPDTVITFSNGTKIIVKEECDEIKEKVIGYKREIMRF